MSLLSPRQAVVVLSRAFWLLLMLPLGQAWADPALAGWPVALKPPESGIASWHDPAPGAGVRTASNHPWQGAEMVAAHRTLPLGTRVRVFNLSNGREVVVVITDRGPYRHGRIIDVSRGAAQKLGLIQSGTARVRVVALPSDAPGG